MREDVVTLEATWRSEREDVDMALRECSKLKRWTDETVSWKEIVKDLYRTGSLAEREGGREPESVL